MRLCQLLDTDIHFHPIAPPADRSQRRSAEQAAVSALVNEVFGPGATLAHRPDGAPYITQAPDTHISISHSRDMALLAISHTAPAGIDTELWRPTLLRVAQRFLTPAEIAGIEDAIISTPDHSPAAARNAALLEAWTLKEAIFKATSHRYPPHSRTLIDIPLPADWRPTLAPSATCAIALALDTPGHVRHAVISLLTD